MIGLCFGFYLCTGSRRTRRRRTKICHKATTLQSFLGCDRGLGKPGPRFGSSDRRANICSGCARDQIYSSQELAMRRFGIALLKDVQTIMRNLHGLHESQAVTIDQLLVASIHVQLQVAVAARTRIKLYGYVCEI